MPGSILGNTVIRLEDPELLVGGASYIDNLDWPGRAHLVLVRSTWPTASSAPSTSRPARCPACWACSPPPT